ncbi:MAG: K(+)-transporting ATPase subunit C [Rhodomicrobiaceae bacterium]
MLRELRPAITFIIAFTLITGIAYPFLVTGIAQVVFPHQANGSLVVRNGTVIGSEVMGQNFVSDRYFRSRPSATTGPDPADPSKSISVPYNAANTSGSNLGPTSKPLIERIKGDVEKLKGENPNAEVPTDLVTASGSGLDPDISPEGALFQVPRIAKIRTMPEERIRQLVMEHIEGRVFGIFGEPHVNVLALNLALDQAAGH